MMVKKGQEGVRRVGFRSPGADASGIEVLSFDSLHRRIQRHTGMEAVQRIDFHQLLLVTDGTVRHMVDFTDYTLTPGMWLWTRPGQVQQFADLSAGAGWIILFTPAVVDPSTATETGLDNPFEQTLWQLAGEGAAAAATALQRLAEDFNSTTQSSAGRRSRILQHLLAILLLRLTDQSNRAGSHTRQHADTFIRFRSAVEEGYASSRQVSDYARALGYSPRTLARATLAAAGVGAKEFIDRRIMLEAQRLLAHGHAPVNQVARTLGFDDASNFVKFFHQRTGVTPATFRRRFQPTAS